MSAELHQQAQQDIQELANNLSKLTQKILKEQPHFLPHAVVLTEEGKSEMFSAALSKNAPEALALLHGAMRHKATQTPLRAVAIAEDVMVTLPGQQPTQAIKVLFENKNGVTVALYQPISRGATNELIVGPYSVVKAKSEICVWKQQ